MSEPKPLSPPLSMHAFCRGAAELQTNFESALTSSFYANLYRLSGLEGGHVIMLGADHASRYQQGLVAAQMLLPSQSAGVSSS